MSDEQQQDEAPQGAPALDQTQAAYVTADAQGRILVSGNVPRFMVDIQPIPEGGSVVIGEGNMDRDWVSGGAIVPRPANPTVLDGMTLRNLPAPCIVAIDGTPYECPSDEAALNFAYPATYAVTVSAWPYVDAQFSVVYEGSNAD